MTITRLFITGLLAATVSSLTLAQGLLDPPEKIEFGQWRPAAQTEYYARYWMSFPTARPSQFPENNDVRLQVYVPTNRIGKVPVVLLLHFWGATDSALEEEFAEILATKGIASVIMPMPYHLSRTPEGFRSGELMIQSDVEDMKQKMAQTVSDIRRTVDWMETRPELDMNRLGLTGTSLGGIVSAMAFGVEPRFKFGAFLLAGVDMAHIIFHSNKVAEQREQFRRKGFTEESLREALKEVEPLTYLSSTDPRPIYIVRARHDEVVPLSATDRLESAIGPHQTLWLETGHYGGFLVKRGLVRNVSSFFQSEFNGRSFDAPKTFYAPTIRVGVGLNPEDGMQVLAGLDVWRLEGTQAFGSLLFSPRGPRAFLGSEIDRGISIGAMFTPQRTTFGVFWSTVF